MCVCHFQRRLHTGCRSARGRIHQGAFNRCMFNTCHAYIVKVIEIGSALDLENSKDNIKVISRTITESGKVAIVTLMTCRVPQNCLAERDRGSVPPRQLAGCHRLQSLALHCHAEMPSQFHVGRHGCVPRCAATLVEAVSPHSPGTFECCLRHLFSVSSF